MFYHPGKVCSQTRIELKTKELILRGLPSSSIINTIYNNKILIVRINEIEWALVKTSLEALCCVLGT